jgi:leucyl aminopeptidase
MDDVAGVFGDHMTADGASPPTEWHLVFVTASGWPRLAAGLSLSRSAWLSQLGFAAASGEIALAPAETGGQPVAYAGLGEGDPSDPFSYTQVVRALPPGRYHLGSAGSKAEDFAVALGGALGTYRFDQFKSDDLARAELILAAPLPDQLHAIVAAERDARDWINLPASHQGPAELLALVNDELKPLCASVRSFIGDELILHNFPTVATVGAGSVRAPGIVEACWGADTDPLLVLVGKGVCFDSGGINLKPDDDMYAMKSDMGGAALMLALARLIISSRLPVRLRLIVPAVDNMPSGGAMRQGDVVATRNGTTVEIAHTDYEGRLILADALAWASEGERPDLIIDAATLSDTGLGPDFSAYFTADDVLAGQLDSASRACHDMLWRQPLWPAYAHKIESNIADLRNCEDGGDATPAIAAALFLQHFVPVGVDWIHIDLEAWNPDHDTHRPYGGNIVGLRALFAMLMARYPHPSGFQF